MLAVLKEHGYELGTWSRGPAVSARRAEATVVELDRQLSVQRM